MADEGMPPQEHDGMKPEDAAAPDRGAGPGGGPGTVSGVVSTAWAGFRGTLREAARWRELARSPYGLTPVVMFSLIFIVQGFDRTIFPLLLPDIIRDLDIGVQTILTIQGFMGFIAIFATLAIAFLLDRVRRIPFLAGGTIGAGVFSLFTSQAGGAFTLGASRMGDIVSDIAWGTPTFSLAADYYPAENRGKTFAAIATLTRLGTRWAPLAIAVLALYTSWRTPFVFTGGMLILLGIIALKVLKEPVRGYMERRALGMDEESARQEIPAPSFGEAWRTIWGIRTLRRLFVGSMIAGVGDAIIVRLFPLFLADVYGLDVMGRAWIIFVIGMFGVAGGFIGGGIVDVLLRRRPQRVLIFSGVLSLIASLFVLAYALVPPLLILYAVGALFGFFGALIGPARSVFFAQIVPANMRTLGLSMFVLADIPVTMMYFLLIQYQPTWGLTGLMAAVVPFLAIGALVDISAAGFFERDMRNAVLSQRASEDYRKAREEGRLKLLVCRGLEVEYSGVQVLFGVDLEVEQGEIVALLGANGAGKSTVLKAIAGAQEASGGAVLYEGRDITHVPPYEISRIGVSLMPGGRGVFPGLSVAENLRLATWHLEVDEGRQRYAEVLELFPTLRAKQTTPASMLSGGEQQMVAVAMAFLGKPRLLMIDELSLGLSPQVVQELLEAVRAMRDRGITIILVEQSVNVALTIAERAVFMEKGEIRFSGRTADLLRRPDILRAVYVRGAAAIGARVSDAEAARDRARLEAAPSILEVSDLAVSFGGVKALDGASLELRDGEILGIIGPNGAGKTTLFDVISGFVPPDRGRILMEGVDITALAPDQRSRLQLIRRFQDARLYPGMSVSEAIMVSLDRHHRSRSMLLTALQLPAVRQSERRLHRRADELVELLGLGAFRDKFIRELSTGLRRICDLACTLAAEPKVLLLDEPSSGIAQAEAESLGPMLRRVRREIGCSILLIEHDMPLVSAASDEMLAMVQGRVVVRGSADEVLAHPLVVESYLGTSEEAIRRSGVLT